ncbi:histidinol-phosphate transaminase [Limnobacter sp.]|uniref:histidinol-phosphate transaminase n=1 Tax=Limnobacter sp. TaxID=2003368 RepID=UPI002587078B|nr:histidinol-phosphate transaminase [Limnobacter sp.]
MSALQNTVRADVQATQAYVVANATGMVKLDAMENPHELPLALREELAERLKHAALNRYPEPQMPALESALRQAFDIPEDAAVLFGNGSDELIDIVIRTCCMPGDVVLSPVPTFVMYAVSSQWAHARFVGVDFNADLSLNLPALLQAIDAHKPKVVFLAYPNNPTGVAMRKADIDAVIQAAPGLVVVDEAYEAFADESFMPDVLKHPNVLVLRTLSKLGLAGIRLGYAVASKDWISQIDKVRPPYNVNILTRIAAEFALRHHGVLDDQAARLRENRAKLSAALKRLAAPRKGMEVFDSHANFLLFRVPQAQQVFELLKNEGILIKYVGKMHPLLQDCLRVTVSTDAENQSFLTALEVALNQLS